MVEVTLLVLAPNYGFAFPRGRASNARQIPPSHGQPFGAAGIRGGGLAGTVGGRSAPSQSADCGGKIGQRCRYSSRVPFSASKRCTASRFGESASAALDTAPVLAALRAMQGDAALAYAADGHAERYF